MTPPPPVAYRSLSPPSLPPPLARVAALEWGDADAAHALGTFGLVLASDCVYEIEHAPLFLGTLAAALHPRGVALLAWDQAIGRPAALDAFRACVDRLPQRTAGPPADCGFSPPTVVLKGE